MTACEEYVEAIKDFRRKFKQFSPKRFEDCNNEDAYLQADLIEEEHLEYQSAESRTDIIDALSDLLYVTIGAYVAVGLKPPEIPLTILPLTKFKDDIINQVAQATQELRKSQLCCSGLQRTLDALFNVIHLTAHGNEIDIINTFKEVHTSNMTKLWTSLEDVPKQAIVIQVGNNQWLVKTALGKVLKPKTYQPPYWKDGI